MEAKSIDDELSDRPVLVTDAPDVEALLKASSAALGTLEQFSVGTRRWRGVSPWERHRTADELIFILEGGPVTITVLTDSEAETVEVSERSVFIVPRGCWHKQVVENTATVLGVSPTGDADISFAEDPRSSN